jgi:hypothetical protein
MAPRNARAHGARHAATSATALAIVATWWQPSLPRVVFSDGLKANHDRTDRVNHFNEETPLLALDQTLVAPIPLGLMPESDPAFVTSKPIPITFVRSVSLGRALGLGLHAYGTSHSCPAGAHFHFAKTRLHPSSLGKRSLFRLPIWTLRLWVGADSLGCLNARPGLGRAGNSSISATVRVLFPSTLVKVSVFACDTPRSGGGCERAMVRCECWDCNGR